RPKILQGDVCPGDLAQEGVHLSRGHAARRGALRAVLKQTAARQLPQQLDGFEEPRRREFFGDDLSALRSESQGDVPAVHRDVRFEQSRCAARAVQAVIVLAPGSYSAARDELDNSSAGELPRHLATREMLAEAPSYLRQCLGQSRQPPSFATLPHIF